MTYAVVTSAEKTPPRPPRRAFTIVEILVVVAIIVLLVGILVPAMSVFQKHAKASSTSTRLLAIRTGIEQYYNEFREYPPSSTATNFGGLGVGRGPAMLAQSLMGYMGSDVDGAGRLLANGSVTPAPGDQDPALGFRTRRSSMGGQVYGPYVPNDPASFKQNDNPPLNPPVDAAFIDPYGKEILYYRSLRIGPNVSKPAKIFDLLANNNSYFASDDCNLTYSATPPGAPLNPLDTPNVLTAEVPFFQLLTTVTSAPPPPAPGYGNTFTTSVLGSGSYLLLSAGPDKIYFTADDIVLSKP